MSIRYRKHKRGQVAWKSSSKRHLRNKRAGRNHERPLLTPKKIPSSVHRRGPPAPTGSEPRGWMNVAFDKLLKLLK